MGQKSTLTLTSSLRVRLLQTTSARLNAELVAKSQAEKVRSRRRSRATRDGLRSDWIDLSHVADFHPAAWRHQVLAETKRKQMQLISTLQEDILSPEEEEALKASYSSEEEDDGPSVPSAFTAGGKKKPAAGGGKK